MPSHEILNLKSTEIIQRHSQFPGIKTGAYPFMYVGGRVII